MYSLQYAGQFKKDLKRLKKRSQKNFKILETFIEDLIFTGFVGIPVKHKPHKLIGNYKDCCECHVLSDLLIIWKENPEANTIVLIRTGTHFKWKIVDKNWQATSNVILFGPFYGVPFRFV